RLMKEWVSPIYAFFEPKPCIIEHDGRRAHHFKCCTRGCKTMIRCTVHGKHVKACWGDDVLQTADQAKDAEEVRTRLLVESYETSITASFERKGKGKVMYSHRQHTRTETKAEIIRWVAESLRPFKIVKDRGFQSLMKTGQPEYYLPSPATMSCDVQLVFTRTRQRIAKMTKAHSSIN
ncbi:hypothetical protein DFJ58DRAFT_670163, partial [Suillus subalutaceus]|uniref:uncharacterized protein n=1 Tax=Suillus subalutaceus TaxID=48586 RepID=UPI001B86B768